MKSREGLGTDCILKPENVSSGCTDIFNALGDEFLFSTILRASFDFLGPKTGGGVPHDTALRFLALLDAI